MEIKFKLIILLAFGFLQLISAANSNMDIKIVTSKNTYLLAEPIEVGITLKNVSGTSIKTFFPHPAFESLKLNIISSEGKTIPYTGITGCTEKNFVLQPSEEFYLPLSLDEFYGLNYCKNLYSKAIEPGSYNLEAIFSDGDINVKSNRISFNVIYPYDNELNVYEEFIKISNQLDLNNINKITTDCNSYLAIVDDNPSSVYAPLILAKLSAFYTIPLNDVAKSNQIKRRILEEYSNSSMGRHYINTILDLFKEDQNKLEFLQTLKQKSKNSLMEKIIDQKIKEIGF